MTLRVVVHAGFHKTGTSTVQATLRARGAALAPDWVIGLEEDFPDAAASARAYSVAGEAIDIGLFQAGLVDWLEALDVTQARGLLISCESLAGEIPGRIGGSPNYRRGKVLLPAMIEALRAVLGDDVPVDVFLSTRGADSWLESLHWQLTRGGVVADDFADFAARLRKNADLQAQAEDLATALTPIPGARLGYMAIEDSTHLPEGPLTPILDLMGIPPEDRAPFSDLVHANTRPTLVDRVALADQFAQMNRSGLSRDDGKKAKRAILRDIWSDEAARQKPQEDKHD